MAGHCAIVSLRGTFRDVDHVRDPVFALTDFPGWPANGPTGA